jgi:hypothetical protein
MISPLVGIGEYSESKGPQQHGAPTKPTRRFQHQDASLRASVSSWSVLSLVLGIFYPPTLIAGAVGGGIIGGVLGRVRNDAH